MSPLLFPLYLEPLCVVVKNCSLVRGYRLLAEEVKVLAYADDVTYFCEDKRSVEHALWLTQEFYGATGTLVNTETSTGLRYGT